MKFGSLFSGIGGIDLGLERAGMEPAWQVEIDDACQGVLASHWPDVERFTDVRECGRHNLRTVDLIAGGFPCQDVSVAGKRAGLAGERSGLWREFRRIIAELTPRWVVIENVPGLLSSNGGRDFAVVLRGLVECGYGVAYRILDSQYFGVAQRRRRVFVVASLGSGRCAEVLFERESGAWDTPPRRGERAELAAAVVSRIGNGDFTDPVNDNVIAFDLAQITSNVNRTRVEIGLPASTLNQAGQMHVAQPAHRAYGVRKLTPAEAERLQGFPDGWTSGQADSKRYRQLGNAVTVNVAEWIGRRIMEVAA